MTKTDRSALVLILLAAMAGCGHPVQRQLEGRWLGDGVENFDEAQIAPSTGWAKGTSMEFAGSSITVAIPAEEPRVGKYKIAKVHDSDVHLAVVRPNGRLDKLHFKLDDDHGIRWMLEDGRAVLLRREQ
jgi:hypothetical protein